MRLFFMTILHLLLWFIANWEVITGVKMAASLIPRLIKWWSAIERENAPRKFSWSYFRNPSSIKTPQWVASLQNNLLMLLSSYSYISWVVWVLSHCLIEIHSNASRITLEVHSLQDFTESLSAHSWSCRKAEETIMANGTLSKQTTVMISLLSRKIHQILYSKINTKAPFSSIYRRLNRRLDPGWSNMAEEWSQGHWHEKCSAWIKWGCNAV